MLLPLHTVCHVMVTCHHKIIFFFCSFIILFASVMNSNVKYLICKILDMGHIKCWSTPKVVVTHSSEPLV